MTSIVHVTPLGWGEFGVYGGGERYVMELARAMTEQVSVRVITFGERYVRRTVDGVDIEVLPIRARLRRSDLNPLSERLIGALKGADVIHIHQWESMLSNVTVALGRLRGTPVFATDHGGFTRNLNRRLRLHRFVAGLLPVSHFGASFYPEFGDRHRVIYGGVDVDRYAPDPAVQRTGVVAVGRLLPHKGVDLLIEGLSPDTELTVIGRPYDDAFLARLQQLARGKNVRIVTDADDDTVRAAYRRAAVSVLASQYDPPHGPRAPKAELLGLALLEAMASGCPAVATQVGGMPEVVEDGVTGFVVPPLDRSALATAVEKLAADPALNREMSRAARARVCTQFTWQATATRCLEAYAELG